MNAKQVPELVELAIEAICEDPNQVRQDAVADDDSELTESIRDHDVQEPPQVYADGNVYRVFSGGRRVRCAKAAGKKSLLVCVHPSKPDLPQLHLKQLLANAHRVDLNPMELCDSYREQMELRKINATELAQLVSKSKTFISNVLSLANLDAELQLLIRQRKLGLAHGAMLARMKPDEQRLMLERLKAGEPVKRDELEQRSSTSKKNGKPVRRVALETSEATLNIVGKSKLTIPELIAVFQRLIRECKKAKSQGLDLSTLASILRDRASAERAQTEDGK